MSLSDTRKTRKRLRSRANSVPEDELDEDDRPRRGRWQLKLFLLLVVVGGLLAFTPTLVCQTSLAQWLTTRFAPIDGSLEYRSLSIGWLTPLSATDVAIHDLHGNVVAEAAAIDGDKSLLALLIDRKNIGRIEFERPTLNVVLREDGSNIEDVLAPILAKGEKPPTVTLALKITDGTAHIDDQHGKHKYEIRNLATDLTWDTTSKAPLTVQAAAKLIDGRRQASIEGSLTTEAPDKNHRLGAGHLICHIDRLPLDVAEPLIRRYVVGAQLAGSLSTKLTCNWGGGPRRNETSIQGQIDVEQLLFTAAAMGDDRLEIEELHAPCQIVGTSEELRIEELQVDCDLGKIEVTGKARLADFTASDLAAALVRESCQVTGQLDLVRVAALFPETLHIRPGTQITSGKLNISLATQAQDHDIRWRGRLETSDLEALADGQKLSWKQPLVVEFQARDGSDGPIVDKLECAASFLRVEGSGTLDRLSASANFDLSRLAEEMSRFVDLRGYELAGSGEAQLTWQRDAKGQAQAQGEIRAHDFALLTPSRRPWREPTLVIAANASAQLIDRSVKRIDRATIRLDAAEERLSLQLTQALDDPWGKPWPVKIDWQGEIASLVPRIEPWVDLEGWNLAGRCHLQATAEVAANHLDIHQSDLDIERLHIWGHGLYIDEQSVDISGSARWRREKGNLEIPLASVKGNAAIVRLNNVEVDKSAKASGGATMEVDLATLTRWLQDPRTPITRRIAGQIAGKVDMTHADGISRATLNTTIDNFQVVEMHPAPVPSGALFQPASTKSTASVWQEPRIAIAARVDYDQVHDELHIAQGTLTAAAVQGQVAGKISKISTLPNVDLAGQLLCDWEKTSPLWRPFVGQDIRIVGHETFPFSLRGPWTPDTKPVLAGAQQMTGGTTIKWLSANVDGLQVNSGTIEAVLKEGAVRFVPINVEVSGGRMTLAPVIHLATQPAYIELPRGPVVQHVQLTPEVCSRALKYIAPPLAEVTRADGQFSLDLVGGRLPLADPLAGDVAGQLQIHSVEVRPGPIMQSLLGFAQQLEGLAEGKIPFANPLKPVALVRLENQLVDFRLQDGRVYHRGLKLSFGNVTITTHGYVGLDQTLDVMAEFPVGSRLLGGSSKLKNIETKNIQIPIKGTLKNPKIDPRSIEKVTASLIGNTAKGLLFDRLEEGLEKLLPPER